MPDFSIKIVRKEWLSNWYEYAGRKEPSEETKKLGREGHLGITRLVTAKNKVDAESKVRSDNPGFVIISEDTQRLR